MEVALTNGAAHAAAEAPPVSLPAFLARQAESAHHAKISLTASAYAAALHAVILALFLATAMPTGEVSDIIEIPIEIVSEPEPPTAPEVEPPAIKSSQVEPPPTLETETTEQPAETMTVEPEIPPPSKSRLRRRHHRPKRRLWKPLNRLCPPILLPRRQTQSPRSKSRCNAPKSCPSRNSRRDLARSRC